MRTLQEIAGTGDYDPIHADLGIADNVLKGFDWSEIKDDHEKIQLVLGKMQWVEFKYEIFQQYFTEIKEYKLLEFINLLKGNIVNPKCVINFVIANLDLIKEEHLKTLKGSRSIESPFEVSIDYDGQ